MHLYDFSMQFLLSTIPHQNQLDTLPRTDFSFLHASLLAQRLSYVHSIFNLFIMIYLIMNKLKKPLANLTEFDTN